MQKQVNKKTPKNKFSDKRTISKKIIAIIQLHDAINLYYNKSYISSITLAAAAEEILAKLSDEAFSKKIGVTLKNNYAEETSFLISHFTFNENDDLSNFTEEEQEDYYNQVQKQLISNRNKIRNELKHKNKGKMDLEFTNFKIAAEDHIAGAIINYQLFRKELPKDEIILKYCLEKGIS